LLTAAPVHSRRMKSLALLGAGLAVSLALTGCSSSSDGDTSDGGSSAGASASPYLPVPDGVALTEPGSELSVGDHAVVAFRPRQDQVAALDIQVTALERTGIKSFSAWQLSNAQQKSTPYFVRAKVENVGDTDLSGRPVPLYVVTGDNVLLEPTPFASSFEACPSTPFPKGFKPGATAKVCLVYLAPDHGKLTAVSFRPDETFDPITWTGDVVRYEPPAAKKGKKARAGNR
jgi:hypothetical protein